MDYSHFHQIIQAVAQDLIVPCFLFTGVWLTTWTLRLSCQAVTWAATTRTETEGANTRKRSFLKSFPLMRSCRTKSTRSTCE